MKARTAPRDRGLQLLEAMGYMAADVEGKRGPTSRDCFGCIDLHGVHRTRKLDFIYVQVTSDNGGNVSARVKKVLASPRARTLLRAGARVEVWGFTPNAPEPRIVALRLQGPKEPATTSGRNPE